MKTPHRLQVGIDFSKERADIALLHPDGEPIELHRPFANSLPGYHQARDWLLETVQAHSFEGLDIAGEATSYYWLPFFWGLFQDGALAAYDPQLYLLNARWVRWYKQSLSPDHKDDATDPRYIADRLRTKKPTSAWTFDPKWLPLRFYTRLRFHLVKSLTREKNLFHLYLFLAHSAYGRNRPFSDPLGATSQRLLRQPEALAQLGQLALEDLREQLEEWSEHRLPDPQANAESLRQVLADSFPIPPALVEPLQNILELVLDTIHALEAQIHQLDQHIQHHVQSGYPEVAWLDSIPGIGPVLAAGIAAEIGDLQRFRQVPKWDRKRKGWRARRLGEVADAIAKLAGLWWPKNASGQFEAEERRLTKEGNAYLRYYVVQAGDRMRQHIPRYARFYQQKHDEARKHKHKRALVLTGRKALNLFVALLHHQETYRAKEADAPLA
jgi:Transposase/Transposase IS116/IS110/IS902 family